jgi:hypothetical protein
MDSHAPICENSAMAELFAAVSSVDFQVCKTEAVPARLRFMDLFLNVQGGINQVGLSFEDRQDFVIGEQFPNYIEVRLPISYLADIQYLVKSWNQKNLEIGYDATSGSVANFCLRSVNQ